MQDLLKLISNENYIIVNRDLIKEIGLDETILLSELCSEQYYWKSKDKLGKDGFFFSTIENIENNIGFKKKKTHSQQPYDKKLLFLYFSL